MKFKVIVVIFFLIAINSFECIPGEIDKSQNTIEKLSFDQVYETDSNRIYFNFDGLNIGWLIVKNLSNTNIDVTYFRDLDNKASIAKSRENFNPCYLYHSELSSGNKLDWKDNQRVSLEMGEHQVHDYDYIFDWDDIKTFVLEFANGNVKKYSLTRVRVDGWNENSNLSNGIVINLLEFYEQEVSQIEKILEFHDTMYLVDPNFCKKKEDKYSCIVYFKYDTSKERLIITDRIGNSDILKNEVDLTSELCTDFIETHPEIKLLVSFTELPYKFIFKKNVQSKYILTEIDGYNWDNLQQLFQLKETHVVYKNKYYRKLDNSINDTVIQFSPNHPNFINNNPYGFKENYYYDDEKNLGYILQWIDKDTCLYDFAPNTIYTAGMAISLIQFNSLICSYPFNKNILYHYEGVFSYTTASGAKKTVPKFSIIFDEEDLLRNDISDSKIEDFISVDSIFFRENNPYGLDKNCKYYEPKNSIKGKVLQWLDEGCLYDFSGGITDYKWSSVVYIEISENERNKFFDENFIKYYKYLGVFSYETVNHVMNTVPKLKVYFEQ